MAEGEAGLGPRLREAREARGWSLRHVASRAGVNHGYLSQLERGEVAEPGPSVLHKVAAGYDVPFTLLMEWAGYVGATGGLTDNQTLALSYLGDDISDAELEALRAVIDAIRARRATFASSSNELDSLLSLERRREIQATILMLLRRSDAEGLVPTPLDTKCWRSPAWSRPGGLPSTTTRSAPCGELSVHSWTACSASSEDSSIYVLVRCGYSQIPGHSRSGFNARTIRGRVTMCATSATARRTPGTVRSSTDFSPVIP
jgi:transcriptional regulator with XRE-family HTH domain